MMGLNVKKKKHYEMQIDRRLLHILRREPVLGVDMLHCVTFPYQHLHYLCIQFVRKSTSKV